MKKALIAIIASLFLLSLTVGMAMAADDNAGDGEFVTRGVAQAEEGGDAVAYIDLVFNSHWNAYAIKVDWNKTFQYVYCALKDVAIPGDTYYATFGRRTGPRVVTTTNQTTGGSYYAPHVWSPTRSVYGKNTTIWVTPGRMTGGLPAGMQVWVSVPGVSNFTYKIYKY